MLNVPCPAKESVLAICLEAFLVRLGSMDVHLRGECLFPVCSRLRQWQISNRMKINLIIVPVHNTCITYKTTFDTHLSTENLNASQWFLFSLKKRRNRLTISNTKILNLFHKQRKLEQTYLLHFEALTAREQKGRKSYKWRRCRTVNSAANRTANITAQFKYLKFSFVYFHKKKKHF